MKRNNLKNFFYGKKELSIKEINEITEDIKIFKSMIENGLEKGPDTLSLENIKQLKNILLTFPIDYLKQFKLDLDPKNINKEISLTFTNNEKIEIAYEKIGKYLFFVNFLKTLDINANTNIKENIEKFEHYQKKFFKYTNVDSYIKTIQSLNLNHIFSIKDICNIDFLPYEISINTKKEFGRFLDRIQFLFITLDNNTKLSKFLNIVIQKNLLSLIKKEFLDKNKKLNEKVNNILDFYDRYLSYLYIIPTRIDLVELFGEIFINFTIEKDFLDKRLFTQKPDRLLRFSYIKFYPFLEEIVHKIKNNELKLGFISTLKFIERLKENKLDNKYNILIKQLYENNILSRLDIYKTINKQSKLEYYNIFIKKYPEFKKDLLINDIENKLNIVFTDKYKILKNIKNLDDFIILHKQGKIKKIKLNKKNFKSFLNNHEYIYIKHINYLLQNNLLNIKNKDLVDLILPKLTPLGIIILSQDSRFKHIIDKQRLIKLAIETKSYRFLITLEELDISLTKEEQEKIFNILNKNTSTNIEKIFIKGFSLFKDITTQP